MENLKGIPTIDLFNELIGRFYEMSARIDLLMPKEKFDTKIEDLSLSKRAINVLRLFRLPLLPTHHILHGKTGIDTLGELISVSKMDFLKQRNCGEKTLAEIEKCLKELDLSFK
jgi:DNA-directed RNA polymerase alpha subunit